MNFNNKKIKKLTGKVSSCSNSPTIKHKHYRLPIAAILTITLILTSSFLVFFSDKLFTSPTTDTQPNIPPINPPYTTPQLLWKTDVGNYIWGISTVTNGIIYTTTGGMAKTINATDGNIIWEQKIMSYGYPLSSPIINGKTIYVNSALGLLALNATDGKTMCRYTYGDWVTPVVFNGVVYAVGNDVVFALNANTGKKLWEYTTKDSWS
jgi:outer membrane protein assembly factor BamB